MKYRVLKTGDPCPFCGQPLRQTDPDALRLLAAIADIVGLPERNEEVESLLPDLAGEGRDAGCVQVGHIPRD